MALIQCNFFSDTLGRSVNMNVILPEPENCGTPKGEHPVKVPVLYLLHGLSDDYTAWIRNSSVERYASEKGLAVIMADAQKSFYTDMKQGGAFYSFFTDELIRKSECFFNVSGERDQRYIAGLSMGGYGALKIAFRTGLFSAVGSFSGAVDIFTLKQRLNNFAGYQKESLWIFGEKPNKQEDLFYLCEGQRGQTSLRIYHSCGVDDFLYEDNLKLKTALEKRGDRYTYNEGSGGHEWTFWDSEIKKFIEWL